MELPGSPVPLHLAFIKELKELARELVTGVTPTFPPQVDAIQLGFPDNYSE